MLKNSTNLALGNDTPSILDPYLSELIQVKLLNIESDSAVPLLLHSALRSLCSRHPLYEEDLKERRNNKPTFCSLLRFDLYIHLWGHPGPPQIQGSGYFEVVNLERAWKQFLILAALAESQ